MSALTDTSVVPGSTVSYTVVALDAAGNASAASAPAAITVPGLVTAYTYDPAGNLLTSATPDGVTARSTYDAASRRLEVATTESDGTLARFTSAYDAAGNRIELTTLLGTTYYSYDTDDRLTSACSAASCAPPGAPPLACLACVAGTIARPAASLSPNPADTLTSYAYDPVGNRLSRTNYQGTTTSTYDAADRLTATSGPGAMSYTYDADGNELTAGSTTYTYDLADRMISATVGATTESYTWTGDGLRRSAATGPGAATSVFLLDRSFALPEIALLRDGTGKVLRTARYGLGRIALVDAAGGIAYEHPDGLGSVRDRTSSAGVSLAWAEYAPFGTLRSAGSLASVPLDPFGFTGQYQDAVTGLLHLRARQYDPGSGRFLSVDPVSSAVGDPYVAAYVYAAQNPLRYTDPSGRCADGGCVTGGWAIGPFGLSFTLCATITSTVRQASRAHWVLEEESGLVRMPARADRSAVLRALLTHQSDGGLERLRLVALGAFAVAAAVVLIASAPGLR